MTKWTMAYRELFVLTSLVILLPTLTSALLWRKVTWFPMGLLVTHWLVLLSSCATETTRSKAHG